MNRRYDSVGIQNQSEVSHSAGPDLVSLGTLVAFDLFCPEFC